MWEGKEGGGRVWLDIEWKIVQEKYILRSEAKLHAFPPPKLIHFHADQGTNKNTKQVKKRIKIYVAGLPNNAGFRWKV